MLILHCRYNITTNFKGPSITHKNIYHLQWVCLKECEKSLELGERSLEIGGGGGNSLIFTTILTIVQTGAVHSTK